MTHSIERYLTPNPKQRDALLSPAEVSEWIHVAVSTLADWRSDKRDLGPRVQPVGRRIFYRASDVQAWLDAQRESA